MDEGRACSADRRGEISLDYQLLSMIKQQGINSQQLPITTSTFPPTLSVIVSIVIHCLVAAQPKPSRLPHLS